MSSTNTLEHTTLDLELPSTLIYYFPTLRHVLALKKAKSLSLGSTLYGGALVASGELVADIFTGVNAHDGAALKIIIDEAGGEMTDLFGQDQRYDQPIKGYIASNGKVHKELLDLVKATMQAR